jgi:hypothetical protein
MTGVALLGMSHAMQREYKSGVVWPEPVVVTPGSQIGAAPSDAKVLFDGKDLSQWVGGDAWEIKEGYAIVRGKNITTKESFGDCQLHVEFATPDVVKGTGQGRGNSGIFLMDRYELQILDSFDNKTYFDGQCGAIYKQTPPMVNVCRKPGEWQSYDIIFEAPKFADDGKLLKHAYMTVLHNGVLVQNHFELKGNTYFDRPAAYTKHPERQPIRLQNHGNPVKFRNIWIREITPIVGKDPEPKDKN